MTTTEEELKRSVIKLWERVGEMEATIMRHRLALEKLLTHLEGHPDAYCEFEDAESEENP